MPRVGYVERAVEGLHESLRGRWIRLELSSVAEVTLWAQSLREPAPRVREVLRRRVEGQSPAVIAEAVGRPVRGVRTTLLSDAPLRVLAPHLLEVSRWRAAVDSGLDVVDVAAAYRVEPWVVELALFGFGPEVADVDTVMTARRLWAEGEPLTQIAAALGVSLSRLEADLAAGLTVLGERRLQAREITARYGWGATGLLGQHVATGAFPAPAGWDGPARWWWARDVDAWEQRSDLVWCSQCRRAFLNLRGLHTHRTRVHGHG